jgi:hypothetical protein
MQIAHGKKRIFIFSILVVLVLATTIVFYAKKSWDQKEVARSVSSLRQVYFWTREYENLKREDSSNLKDIIKYFTTLNPTDEYKSLISALEGGDLVYKPNPIPGEPMIRWKKKNSTIELMPDGNVRSFAK